MEIPLRVAVVDDDRLARQILTELLIDLGCQVIAEFSDGEELLNWWPSVVHLDALFLDIGMPKINGLETLKRIQNPPLIVFVTASPEYARSAWNTEAIAFVEKFKDDELKQAVRKIKKQLDLMHYADEARKIFNQEDICFPTKVETGKIFLSLFKTSYFERKGEYVLAWAGGKSLRTFFSSLDEVEEKYPTHHLVRINRHLLVRIKTIIGYRPSGKNKKGLKVMVFGGKELPVSRSNTSKVKELLDELSIPLKPAQIPH